MLLAISISLIAGKMRRMVRVAHATCKQLSLYMHALAAAGCKLGKWLHWLMGGAQPAG
jgi:hypothetical protein